MSDLFPLCRGLGLGTSSTDVQICASIPLDVAWESLGGAWDEQTKPLGFTVTSPALKPTPDFKLILKSQF